MSEGDTIEVQRLMRLDDGKQSAPCFGSPALGQQKLYIASGEVMPKTPDPLAIGVTTDRD